jgi:quinolinate synthase
MKKNTLEKLYLCLKNESPAIDVQENIRIPAEQAIRRMLKLSADL